MNNFFEKSPSQKEACPERFLRLKEVKQRTTVSKTKWYELIKQGKAPAPIKIGRSSVWKSSDIGKWMQEQMSEQGGDL